MRDVGEWPLGMPQRRAALRGAATSRSPATAQSPDSASTKGCSQRSSDVRGARVPAQPHSASTKGCSQRSSDLVAGLLELHVDDGLNEGLLSEEQRHGLSKSLTGTSTEPQRRAALRGAATQTCSKAERLCPASTKGCSQRSSDPRRWADPKVSCQSLNEGLLSEEQRRRAPVRNKLGHQRPQRRAALRGAATNKNGIRDAVKGSLNEGLLSEEQRPHSRPTTHSTRPAASTKGCSQRSSDASIVCAIVTVLMPQRRAALRGVATLLVFNADADPDGLNEGLLSEEQRLSLLHAPGARQGSLNEGLLSEEQRPTARKAASSRTCASTKGCSQRSSDPRIHAVRSLSRTRLNEGLLSEEQRPVLNQSPPWLSLKPQRRAALRGAATRRGRAGSALLMRPQRRAALRGAATVPVLTAIVSALARLNEGLLSEEQRLDSALDGEPVVRASTKGCSQRSSDGWWVSDARRSR